VIADSLSVWNGQNTNQLINELDKVIFLKNVVADKSWARWYFDEILPIFINMDQLDKNMQKMIATYVYKFILGRGKINERNAFTFDDWVWSIELQ